MKNPEIKTLTYNLAQIIFLMCTQLVRIMEWGRGTGKSTILARYILDCVTQMPRSSGVLVGSTYEQIKTRTLPSTIAGLEQHGIYKGQHFFVGEKPPASWNWKEPYEPSLDYKQCIIFWNGTILKFVSLAPTAGSGRGMNNDWVLGDEAALFPGDKFGTDVLLTNRGNRNRIAEYPDGTWKYYKDCPLHHSVVLASTTPLTADGNWFIKYEELAQLKPTKFAFLKASAKMNIHNLGKKYFRQAKAMLLDYMYDAEIENIRVTAIKDGFYPRLNPNHHAKNWYSEEYYNNLPLGADPNCLGDEDLDPTRPIHIGMDWGANINCLVVCQDHGQEFRFLKNLFVKSPKIIDDLIVDKFVPYYSAMSCRVVYLWYDPSGNVSQANSRRTYAEQVRDLLVDNGFSVELMTRGNHNETHERKYRLWINVLSETKTHLPRVTFNRTNCKELLISMANAPAKRGKRVAIQKNKSSEKNKSMLQEHATHMSDTADVIICGMFMNLLGDPQDMPEPRMTS